MYQQYLNERRKEVTVPNNLKSKEADSLGLKSKNDPLLLSGAHCSQSIFLMKCCSCAQPRAFISLLPASRILRAQQSFTSILSIPFSPSWHCFYCYKILKSCVGHICMSWGFTPFDKRLTPDLFLDNPTCTFPLLRWFRDNVLSFLDLSGLRATVNHS